MGKNKNQVSVPPNDESQQPALYKGAAIQYSGPLPPPGLLEGYMKVDPSFPERIMSDYEKNSEHARKQAEKALQAQMSDTKRGQWMAFSIIAAGLVGTLALAYLGKDTAAVCTALGTAFMIFKGTFNQKSK